MAYGIIGLLAIFLSLTACYEHPEACMDVRATNYDVKADKPCEGCCKFPSLNLVVSHSYEGNPADTFTYLNLEDLPDIRIRSLSFYLSDFAFHEGKKHENSKIEEFISVGSMEAERVSYNDFNYAAAKVKFGPVKTIQIGTFRNADLYNSVSFNFGIDEEINHGVMDKISSNHALYTKTTDGMYLNPTDGYYFLKMDIQLEDQTFRSINLYGDDLFRSIVLENNFDFTARSTRTIKMGIEYKTWFAGINFKLDNDEVIHQKLSDQFKFSVNFL